MTEAPPQGEAVILVDRGSRTSIRLRRLRNDPRQNLNPRAFAWTHVRVSCELNRHHQCRIPPPQRTRGAPWKAAPRRGPRDKSAGSTRIVHDRGEPAEGWTRSVAPQGGEHEATAFRPCRH